MRNFFKYNFRKIITVRTVLLLNIVVLICKIVYSIHLGFNSAEFEDWRIAKNWVERGVYAEFMQAGPTAYKLPIYPLFISFFMYFFSGYEKEVLIITQHFLYFLLPFVFISLGRTYKFEKTGVLTSILFLISPYYFYYSNVIEATNVFIPLFLLWIWLFSNLYFSNLKQKGWSVILGITTGLLFLTQVVVIPLCILVFLVALYQKKVTVYNSIICFAIASLVYAPWVIRNYSTFDKLVLTKSPFWQNIYFGFVPQVNVCEEIKLISEDHEKHTSSLRKHTNEFAMEKIFQEEVERVTIQNKTIFIKKAIQNAVILWYVPANYIKQGFFVMNGRKPYVLILNASTFISLCFLWRRKKEFVCFSIIFFCCFTFPYTIGHAGNTRFKLDFEWFQFVIISVFLSERLHSNNKARIVPEEPLMKQDF